MPVEVRERYLEIRKVSDDSVVTVIELLSPANKRPGKGRSVYEEKRLSVLGSLSHFVEIDLLRGNPHMAISPENRLSDYYILVSIAQQRPKAQLYSFSLKETLPKFLLPLQDVDEAIAVDMQAIFTGVCDRASYPSRIDYGQPISPPTLPPEDQA